MIAASLPLSSSNNSNTTITTGVGYNLGAALFGGSASLIGASMVSSMGPVNGMVWSGIWMTIMALMCITTAGYIEFWEKRYAQKMTTYNNALKSKSMQKYQQNQFTSTWYLNSKYNQLDTIMETNCEQESDDNECTISPFDHYESPKLYG